MQGELSHEDVQSALKASSSVSFRKSKPCGISKFKTTITNSKSDSSPSHGSKGGGEKGVLEGSKMKEEAVHVAVDIESRESSVVDTELSDGCSTGEFPSDLTFRQVYL